MTKRSNKGLKTGIVSLVAIIIIAIAYFTGNIKLNNNTNNVVKSNIENQENINNELNSNENNNTTTSNEEILIHFFDVGQADSILVQSNGKNMLIDAGTNNAGSTVVSKLNELGVSKIDVLIGTHPHEDHIGGMDDVIDNFEIGTIYMPKIQTNTKTFESVLDSIAKKGLTVTSPSVGDKFNVGDCSCEVMLIGDGSSEEKSNLNLASLVIRMTYGNESYLFMGDAEEKNEESRTWPQTKVLKVGHHGSDTSSSETFLEKVKPEIAIISVGTGNTYGHPKQVTLDRLNKLNAKIYRTDESGDIIITSDGNTNVVTTSK